MTSQRVDAAASAANVSEKQLQHGRRTDDLSAECMLRPADRVNDGADFFHVAVLPDGRVEVRGLQKLILWDAGDALHHFRRVSRIVFLQKLIHAAGMLQVKS